MNQGLTSSLEEQKLISKILAKYLRYTFPESFNYHYLSLYISGQSSPMGPEQILENINTKKICKYDVIIVDVICVFNDYVTGEEIKSYYTVMAFVDDNVDNIKTFHQDYKEKGKDYKYEISSEFEDFMDEYGLDIDSVKWLYIMSSKYQIIG